MTRSINHTLLTIMTLGAVVLAGCGRDDEEAATADLLRESHDILQYVPADSPYVFAGLAPLSDDVLDELEPKLDRVLVAYQAVLREMVAAQQAQGDAASPLDDDEAAKVEAFVDELSSLLSIDSIREAGIARDSLGAFYGNGLLPVMRLELSDTAAFESMLARFEERAGSPMPTAEVAGNSYRYFDVEQLRIVIAVVDGQAVFSMLPATFDEAQTSRALGLNLPDRNITETGILEGLVGKYSFDPYVVGYVDLPKLAERFVGTPTGLDADLMALGEWDSSALSDVCKTEIREVAGIMPRMVFGYTDITPKRFKSNLVFELREDLATGLQALPAAVPGLGVDGGGLLSFGMSFDAKAARSFLEARLDAMEADPFECEYFADVQSGVAGGRQTLQQPLPPMIYDFKGFLAVIDDIEGLDVATQTPPTSVDGTFLIAMDNAPALVAMGTMFSPELAALNLQPDGKAVAMALPQLDAMGISAFAALTDTAVAMSIGEDGAAQAAAALGADTVEPLPFMSFAMDANRYYAFMGEAVAVSDATGENAPTPEMKAAIKDMMQAVADLYDRMSGDLLFTENGVELRMTETLQQ